MMTDNNGHVDGDDYTWQAGPVPVGTVFKPSDTLAELREQFGPYFDAIDDVDAWVREQRSGEPDLRTADQVERDDVAALHRRMEALEAIVRAKVQVGQIDAGRLDALEATVAALVKVLEVRLP